MELTNNDLSYVVRRLPRDVRDLLMKHQGQLFVGGGFIRATITGETPNDVDLFGVSVELLNQAAGELAASRGDTKTHRTKNAITLLTRDRLPIQFITRWLFSDMHALVGSFDFTLCQAAIGARTGQFYSEASDAFYVDLAARRLVYTSPRRDEEAGGSLMRVLKYVKRGYSIQANSFGAVIARLAIKLRDSHLTESEEGTARVLTGLLREVDPLSVVDGLDIVEDEETAHVA